MSIKIFKILQVLSVFTLFVFLISCDKEISHSPVEPEPSRGNIKLESNPESFLIYVNGRNTGSITPDSLLFLDPGEYLITLKKKYFKDSVFSMELAQDQKIEMNIDFTKNNSMYGKLNIISTPVGASISINDSITNQHTPYNFNRILPGEHKIKLSLSQHRDVEFNAIVSSGTTSNYNKILADTSVWVDYQISNTDLISNNLSCVAIDKNGIKWIGSFDRGLIKFNEITFTNYNKSNSALPSDRILTISVDSQNKIWVGTDNGLAIYDGTNWIIYNKTNSGLKSNEILSIKFDDNGITWIGAYTGLYRFDGTNWIRYNDSQNSIWTNDLQLDNGHIWLATTSGIVRLTSENLEYFYDSVYNYPTKIISSVEKDNSGNVWFCHLNSSTARNGISVYNGSAFQNYYLGTTSNAMNYISVDEDNNKWICSNEGLFKLSLSNTLNVYNKSNSLISSDKLSCVTIDDNGDIWLTTYNNGLVKFKISNL